MDVLRSYFTNQHGYRASGKRRRRGGHSDDANDSGHGEVNATRDGEGQGDGVTDDEEEPVFETRKRKASKSLSQDYQSLRVPVH